MFIMWKDHPMLQLVMRYVMIASCIPVLSTRKSTDIEVLKLSMLMFIIVFHYGFMPG